MDRNSIIGLVLIALILFAYTFYRNYDSKIVFEENLKIADSLYNAKNYEGAKASYISALNAKPEETYPVKKIQEIEKILKLQDTVKNVAANNDKNLVEKSDSLKKSDGQTSDSVKNKQLVDAFGVFSGVAIGEKKFITLENQKIKIVLSTKGGRPYSVELKEYTSYNKHLVKLFDGDSTVFGLNFYANNRAINTSDLYFISTGKDELLDASKQSQMLTMRLKVNDKDYIEYVYTLKPNEYTVKFNINMQGMNRIMPSNQNSLNLKWDIDVLPQEKGRDWENDHTTVYYKFHEAEVDYLSERSKEDSKNLETKISWVAFKSQFFSTVLMADKSFDDGVVSQKKSLTNLKYLKHFSADMNLGYEQKDNQSYPFTIYFGPNHYKTLKAYNADLQKLVPLGWGIFGWVNRFAIIPLFNFLGSYIGNFGLLILLMTIILRVVLSPLTFKSYLSSAKMRVLKPQINELNKKIPADKPMERQQATMALYRKVGVNPLGGCIPMLLQMPILIAMYNFFPASIELRQKAFLWASDLSTYDSILNLPFTIPMYGDHISLFTLLMAGSMVLTTKFNSSDFGSSDTSSMPGMKFMTWLMPVMMLLWFNNYSSGLSYYYFVSNMLSIVQIIIIRRFINDDQILQQLNDNKKKPAPKKSTFAQRLEEAAKKRGYYPPKK